ncbi:MAG: 2-hydroxyglutaryl-CoA dehydratase [Planctomycetes bacterium]|nr:2-hydroxyglutaryl-CoA dehydratase [Planctomycetota bacterium]
MTQGIVAGIDAGSTTSKVLLLRGREIIASAMAATGPSAKRTVNGLLDRTLAEAGVPREDISLTVATGYGRRLIDAANRVVSEITAHARGACMLYSGDVPLRTVIDIGGQDSKVIALDDDGALEDFVMNDKCAAGTGRFLEVMARATQLALDELGPVSLRSTRPLPVNSLCTVFAESEVISLLSRGEDVADVIAGVHASIARRIAAMARRVNVEEPAFFSGGPARNVGLQRALATELGVELIVPSEPQMVAALGAAIVAQET